MPMGRLVMAERGACGEGVRAQHAPHDVQLGAAGHQVHPVRQQQAERVEERCSTIHQQEDEMLVVSVPDAAVGPAGAGGWGGGSRDAGRRAGSRPADRAGGQEGRQAAGLQAGAPALLLRMEGRSNPNTGSAGKYQSYQGQ